MKSTIFRLLLWSTICFVGCDKQTQTNTEKIQVLCQKIMLLEQNQSKQLAVMHAQLGSLPATVEKINNAYFTRTHEDALFYHTNMVYLVLAMDKRIQSQFENANAEHDADSALAYYYHTNQVDTIFYCVGQIEDAMAGQESRIESNVNAETRRVSSTWGEQLIQQIKLSAADQGEAAKVKQMQADLAQIQSDLAAIKSRLGISSLPPA